MKTYGDGMDNFRNMSTAVFEEVIKRQIIKSCLNCIQFDSKEEICLACLPQKIRPPARTIVFGCVEWDADIPF